MTSLRLRVPRLFLPQASEPPPPVPAGFTPPWREYPLHGDARRVYVSSSEGDDSNDGLSDSTPKATIAAGVALIRNGYGDHLLLKRGDVWDEAFASATRSGLSADYPAVFGAYGTGARPLLRPTGSSTALYLGDFDHLAVVSLHLRGRYHDQNTSPDGINCTGEWGDFTLEDCKVEQFTNNVVIQGYPSTPQAIGCVVRGNLILDAHAIDSTHAQGLYLANIDGLLVEDNILDHNGWFTDNPYATAANVFRHNLYLQFGVSNTITRRNYSMRASASGLSCRSEGEIVDNISYLDSIAISTGNHESVTSERTISRNIVLDGKDITAELPRGGGIVTNHLTSGSVVEDNLIVVTRANGNQPDSIWQESGATGVAYRRNRIWNKGAAFRVSSGGEFSLDGNHIQEVGANTNQLLNHPSASLTSSANNKFHRAAGDSNWITRQSTAQTVATWKTNVSDTTSEAEEVSYPDTTRDFGTYQQTVIGGSNSIDDFITALRAQSKDNWDERYSQPAVAAWIGAGWGMELGAALGDVQVTPGSADLSLEADNPVITAGGQLIISPPSADLSLTAPNPTVTAGGASSGPQSELGTDTYRQLQPRERRPWADYVCVPGAPIYQGAGLCVEDDVGLARPCQQNLSSPKFIGFAMAGGTLGLDGVLRVPVLEEGVIMVTTIAGMAGVANIGDIVYMSSDASFTASDSANVAIGRVMSYDGTRFRVVFQAASRRSV